MRRQPHPASVVVLGSALLAACAGTPSARPGRGTGAEPPLPPNIIVVLTDDQGYGDFSSRGNPVLRTPHLDRLAAESPEIARFYVSPVCSPTRASLMTGRYAYRTRVVDTWVGRSMMDPEEVTLAEILGRAGYTTGVFGKWHLGDCYPLRPIDQGFDRALVHRGGGLAQPSEPPENERRYTDPILFSNGTEVRTEGYCTDVYFDAALEFVDESLAARKPFFAFIATNAPHDPFHDVPAELYRELLTRDMGTVSEGDWPGVDTNARVYAMIENIDANVGRLLTRLEERGAAEDTIVVFLSDNGPIAGRYNAGLRGSKAGVHEGGIRTPLFVRWPGQLDPEVRVASHGAHIDLLPTLCEAAGAALPAGLQLDGRSLWGELRGEPAEPSDRNLVLQVHRGNEPVREHHFAVIGKRWKLVRASGFGRGRPEPGHPFELYDLATDPGEERDLAAERPELVAELRTVYADWFADVSTTRPDNFAPPRIVVGTAHEPRTVLTHQDWRTADPGGWGKLGTWELRAEEPGTFAAQLRFLEPTRVASVHLVARDVQTSRELGLEGTRLDAGSVRLPRGDFSFQVICEGGSENFSPYQVELTRLDQVSAPQKNPKPAEEGSSPPPIE